MHRAEKPAIALLELDSIARAMRTGDAMVKRATVEVAYAGPVSPGKYLILVTGFEAEVEESWLAGVADAGDHLVDSLYLPGAHKGAVKALHGATHQLDDDLSLGVLETRTVSAAIVACDAALKMAEVEVLEMRLGKGIGGKGVFTLAGEQWDVEAALEAALTSIEDRRAVVAHELIPRPDPLFRGGLT
ncbi:MAG: BMC domain-containing protein [Deltaproteobacteria bacterium]|nr:BMC domain-containing protein [Deltaproteobacteria bacterium]